jgi:hypothetical protein
MKKALQPELEAIWNATPYSKRYSFAGERAIEFRKAPTHIYIKRLVELTVEEIAALTPKPEVSNGA